MQTLLLDDIRTDGGTQSRAGLNSHTLAEYVLLLQGAVSLGLPAPWPFRDPVVVYYDGGAYWLADGFHRIAACRQVGLLRAECDILQGSQRDAVLYSVGANDDHGLRRTDADKRRAVLRLLEDAEWGKWSDREIARRCKVSHPFVAKLREENTPTGNVTSERVYTNKHGQAATMKTGAIGAKRDEKLATPPMGWVKTKRGKCPTCGEFNGVWHGAEYQDKEDEARLRAELADLAANWEARQSDPDWKWVPHPQASSAPAIALRDHWSLYHRGECKCGLRFWADRSFAAWHEPLPDPVSAPASAPDPASAVLGDRRLSWIESTRNSYQSLRDYVASCDYLSQNPKQVMADKRLLEALAGNTNYYDPVALKKKLSAMTNDEIANELHAYPATCHENAAANIRRWLNQQIAKQKRPVLETVMDHVDAYEKEAEALFSDLPDKSSQPRPDEICVLLNQAEKALGLAVASFNVATHKTVFFKANEAYNKLLDAIHEYDLQEA